MSTSVRLRTTLALVVSALVIGHAAPSAAFSPYLVVPTPDVVDASPAYRYANMTDAEAFDALDERAILYQRVASAPGVRAPIRLTGRLHGVSFHSSLPPEERVRSPFEILDARLALALDDFAVILQRHDIDEVVHYTMYRPNVGGGPSAHVGRAHPDARRRPVLRASGRHDSAGAAASRTTRAAPGTRHPAGLAIDVARLHDRKTGRWLRVASHFHGQLGERTCGEGARVPVEPEARELRALVCEASDLGVFTYVLTPNFNAAHFDHFHMEIKPGVRWFLYE